MHVNQKPVALVQERVALVHNRAALVQERVALVQGEIIYAPPPSPISGQKAFSR